MKCIVCDNQQSFGLFLKARRHHPNYYRCKKCGFIFAYPQIKVNYEFLSFTSITRNEYYSRRESYLIRYEIFKNFLPQDTHSVLDIGAGNGMFLNFMKEKGFKVFGIEPSTEAAKFAKETFQVSMANLKLEEIDIIKHSELYDIVTLFNTFEHMSNPDQAIVKIRNMLKDNSILVLELPNIFTIQSFLSHGLWHHFELCHNWFFNKKTITQFLKKHNFEVLYIHYIPKIINLSKIFNGIMTNTVYQFISRDKYLRLRNNKFWKLLDNIRIKIDVLDYFLGIARKI